jgi:transposase
MFLTKGEKERRVIDLYSQGKTYRHIAEEVRISPNDIHTILKKKKKKRIIMLLLIIRNNDKSCLPEPTNYFLKVRPLLKSLLH